MRKINLIEPKYVNKFKEITELLRKITFRFHFHGSCKLGCQKELSWDGRIVPTRNVKAIKALNVQRFRFLKLLIR